MTKGRSQTFVVLRRLLDSALNRAATSWLTSLSHVDAFRHPELASPMTNDQRNDLAVVTGMAEGATVKAAAQP